MKYCLLCTQPLRQSITWRILLKKSFPKVICERCTQKFERAENVEGSDDQSLFTYNEAMKDYLHQYKFLQDIALANVFSEDIHHSLSSQKGVIVPIPMHPEKKRERTFAHIDELLSAANIPFIHLLKKTSTTTQSSKTLQERLTTAPLFQILPSIKVEEKTYILVDDIRTTGTTLQHAKSILITHGATCVKTFTLIKG